LSFRRHFQLKSNPVGVKILTEELRDSGDATRYCEAVRIAASKKVVLSDNLNCAGAELSLGFVEPLKSFKGETKAIVLEPYRETEDYHAVLIIANPEKVMEIARAYKQIFGEEVIAVFSGERAVCGEATANPLETGKPNVSFLCDGARILAGYSANEVVIGFPAVVFREFERAITAGKLKSLCGCLTDDLPDHVKRKFEAVGFEKASDHFVGYVNGTIVNIYIFRGEIINRIGIFASVRLKSENEAEAAVRKLSEGLGENGYIITRRENWVELSKIIILDEDISRFVRKPQFEKIIREEVEEISSRAKSIKKDLRNSD
jgi:uncharacterized protein (DUF169 family)